MELCKLVQKNSRWVWNTLGSARKLKIQIGEESITDFFVLNMKKWKTGNLTIRTFTKREEYLNGADWELWFTGSSGQWLGIRVQAKIINLESEKFNQLHYGRNGKYQVQSLIDTARKEKIFPIYCMYSNWNGRRRRPPIACGTYIPTVYHYGASILSPFEVLKMKKNRTGTHINEIIRHLKPMHCIFCCPILRGHDLPTRASHYIQQMIFKKGSDDANENFDQKFFATEYFLRESPPSYVSQLISDNSDSLLENECFMKDETLMRVTVVKEPLE